MKNSNEINLSITKRLNSAQEQELKESISLLSESDFEIKEGAYYCYEAHAVASLFIEVEGEELEFALAYPISATETEEGEELSEESMQADAFDRFCLDLCYRNDISLDYIY